VREPAGVHPGLIFERFPRLLQASGERHKIREGGVRNKWLREFCRLAVHSQEPLERRHERLGEMLRALGGESRSFRTRTRLAIGLGNPHAGEIGFSLDHATGAPVIPGSSVKGLVRAGARLLEEEEQASRILGEAPPPGRRERSGRRGEFAFLDALPKPWPMRGKKNASFTRDIVTRHHDAESLPGQKRPSETDEPVPLHFLVVAQEATFEFRVLPLPLRPRPDADPALADAWRQVWLWLEVALEYLGAGGKVAVGYGQMAPAADR
jgi:CRISPR-associated protein Cmr6